MLNAGALTFEVTTDKKTVKLKVNSRIFVLESKMTLNDLLRVGRYLTAQAEKVREGTENGR